MVLPERIDPDLDYFHVPMEQELWGKSQYVENPEEENSFENNTGI